MGGCRVARQELGEADNAVPMHVRATGVMLVNRGADCEILIYVSLQILTKEPRLQSIATHNLGVFL